MAKTTTRIAKPRTRVRKVKPVAGASVPEALHEAIEDERDNLGKLDSLLGCLVLALEHGRSDDGLYDPYFPDIAVMARVMVQRVRNALDSVTLNASLARLPGGDAGGRESAV